MNASTAETILRPGRAAAQSRQRRRLLTLLALVVVGAILGYVAWNRLVASRFEHTDNAYVQGPVFQITPQVAGTVTAIAADDTDAVTAGQVLVQLDPADARLAVEQAEAQLAQTVREVRTLYGNNDMLSAQIRAREAEVNRAATDIARLQEDVARRRALARTGAVSAEELEHARNQLASARSALLAAEAGAVAAREQLSTSRSLTDNTQVADHPNVKRAAARLREAMLALDRTQLRAPVAGQVAQRHVQVGQRVQPGTPLLAVIPLDKVWVDANFKESQLRSMRIGQPVELTADLYGDAVVYRGTVAGFGAGTGAAFALLPAQNATGNWIKVVQRLPVRITLDDAATLAHHPLRIGLSMQARVRIEDRSGPALAQAVRGAPADGGLTDGVPPAAPGDEALAAIRRIIELNAGDARVAAPAARVTAAKTGD